MSNPKFLFTIHQTFFLMRKLVLLFGFIAIIFASCEQKEVTGIEDTLNESLTEVSLNAASEFEAFMQPEEIEERNITFNTLNQALQCTGLTSAVFSGQKTIYAPTDDAFAQLGLDANSVCDIPTDQLVAILTYHVTDGFEFGFGQGCITQVDGNVAQITRESFFDRSINDSRVIASFAQFGFHPQYLLRVFVIESVLTPPTNNIVATASSVSDFSSLVAAVVAADPAIAAALSDEDAVYTVFAPTNQAFADLLGALGFNSLGDLVNGIGVDNLSTVLLYHVVDGCAFSNDLSDGLRIHTLQGERLKVDLGNLSLIDKSDTPSRLDPAGLDIITSNGIVHTIDKVLLPDAILEQL